MISFFLRGMSLKELIKAFLDKKVLQILMMSIMSLRSINLFKQDY